MRALAVLVGLAACGGGKTASPPPVDPEPPPPAAEEPPLTHEQHVAALEDIASRGCACADAACFAAVDADLAEVIGAVEVGTAPMPDAQLAVANDALGRYVACATQLGARPEASFFTAFVARLDDVAEAACACKDAACAGNLFGGLLPELWAASSLADKEQLYERIRPTWKRMEGCVAPFEDAMGAQAVVDLTALRDQACACTDAACADRVQADFDAFLMKHRDTKGSEEQAVLIGDLAGQMSACLDEARAP